MAEMGSRPGAAGRQPIDLKTVQVDILVLGAGLAGLRAAWAAQAESPRLNLAVVSLSQGPGGSSFANRNGVLGMQVCFTEAEREAFYREALDLAPPGRVVPSLVQLLAEEGLARFMDLRDLGVAFRQGDDGHPARYPGCFSPRQRRAVILDDLPGAFDCLRQRLEGQGGKLWPGWLVRSLVIDDRQTPAVCRGALLQSAVRRASFLAVQARATIFALGGSAPLYTWNLAGPANPGISLALLARAGVRLVNEAFLQFMWARIADQGFFPIESLAQPGTLVRSAPGEILALPERLKALAPERATHCPVGVGLADAALDEFLGAHCSPRSGVEVFTPREGWFRVAPMAHAGNGGALINAAGETTVTGLYACGECAGGMHGANRVGGAMVLATQVFGFRAGKTAAQGITKDKRDGLLPEESFTQLINHDHLVPGGEAEAPGALRAWLGEKLQGEIFTRDPARLEVVRESLRREMAAAPDHFSRLALESGFLLLKRWDANQQAGAAGVGERAAAGMGPPAAAAASAGQLG